MYRTLQQNKQAAVSLYLVGVRYDMVGRGELRCGKAVEARYGEVRFVQVGRVQARRSWFGSVWSGRVWSVKAVGARSGLVGFGELGHGGHVPVRRGRVWSGSVCYGKGGGLGAARSARFGLVWVVCLDAAGRFRRGGVRFGTAGSGVARRSS